MVRISLREMFLLVLVVTLAIVSLIYASPLWQGIIAFIAMLMVMIAVICSLVDREPRRAFAIGAGVAMVGYLLIVGTSQVFIGNGEFSGAGNFPTTILLEKFFAGINRSGYFDVKTGALIPQSELGALTSAPGGFSPGIPGNTLQTSSGRQVYYRDDPPFEIYIRTGHLWWAFLFGFIGGHFARYIYSRRMTNKAAA